MKKINSNNRNIIDCNNSIVDNMYNILCNNNIIKEINPDVRILGSDWNGKEYTGHDLPIHIHWHHRDHDYSTSNLRKRIFDEESKKK